MKTETLPTGTLSVRFELEKKSQHAEDMQDTLFDIPETLSPRLRWMERHNIKTAQQNEDEDGNTWFAVSCCKDEDPYEMAMSGRLTRAAETEDAALTALALAAGIKLWMEEGA